ncbi:MAG: hypothetical protein H6731_04910 [Myxococcales bacterium]|nr:MAG: hypothetical protein H6731_04910 [Myxococcales bacterium]
MIRIIMFFKITFILAMLLQAVGVHADSTEWPDTTLTFVNNSKRVVSVSVPQKNGTTWSQSLLSEAVSSVTLKIPFGAFIQVKELYGTATTSCELNVMEATEDEKKKNRIEITEAVCPHSPVKLSCRQSY